MYRIGKTTGTASDETVKRAAKHKAIGSLMLAHKWTESVNPTGAHDVIMTNNYVYQLQLRNYYNELVL